MSLITQIKSDLLAARKAKDADRAKLLTTLLSEAQRPGFDDGKRESTDAEVLAVVKKFLKGLSESVAACGGTPTAEQALELEILTSYQPKQLSETELNAIIAALVAALETPSMKDMGRVMGQLKAQYDGQFDGKQASVLVKQALA